MKWLIRSILISSLLAVGVFSFIFFSETGELPKVNDHWQGYILAIILANSGAIALYYINLLYNQHIPWNERRSIRFLVELISGLIIFSFLAVLFYFIYISPNISIELKSEFWINYWDGVVKFGIILSVFIYIFSLVNFSMFSYNQYSVVQIESLQHERNQLKLQFQALKSQLNPHFLFNALNTISSLSSQDIQQAEAYIRKLADTYQYILNTENRKLVSLKEELEMLSAFFYMQKIKYEDWIDLKLSISSDVLETFIPPLTLQMLVENALKHNMVCEERRLMIEVKADEFGISVINNCDDDLDFKEEGSRINEKQNNSHKIGLVNIKKRYHYFTKLKIEVERTSVFTVHLPLLLKSE